MKVPPVQGDGYLSLFSIITTNPKMPYHSLTGSERKRLLNEVAGATDAARGVVVGSCKGIERLR